MTDDLVHFERESAVIRENLNNVKQFLQLIPIKSLANYLTNAVTYHTENALKRCESMLAGLQRKEYKVESLSSLIYNLVTKLIVRTMLSVFKNLLTLSKSEQMLLARVN